MATYNAENYEKGYVTKPSEKIEKGEVAGRKRLLFDVRVLDFAAAVNDEILCGFIPASSMVTDAKIKINKSLGATGIFQAGYKANGVDAEDDSAFVAGADAGGQAVLQRAGAANAGIFKRFSEETQVFLKCTEVMDGTVLDGVIQVEIEYVND